jgi:ketosteroid isomerase-like protein
VTSDEENIRALNAAVGNGDLRGFTDLMHSDAVWEHNPGSGSPEEGEYKGRDRILKLFERILEGWEYMRPEAEEIREAEPGVYLVRGQMYCKHRATENVIVEQYDQRLEMRDGLMGRGRMVIGSAARG